VSRGLGPDLVGDRAGPVAQPGRGLGERQRGPLGVVEARVLVPGGEGGRPVMIMAFTVADGAITAIRTLTDSDRLAQVVPSWVT